MHVLSNMFATNSLHSFRNGCWSEKSIDVKSIHIKHPYKTLISLNSRLPQLYHYRPLVQFFCNKEKTKKKKKVLCFVALTGEPSGQGCGTMTVCTRCLYSILCRRHTKERWPFPAGNLLQMGWTPSLFQHHKKRGWIRGRRSGQVAAHLCPGKPG